MFASIKNILYLMKKKGIFEVKKNKKKPQLLATTV